MAAWSTIDKNGNVTLSSGNLVATGGGSAGVDYTGRGDASTEIASGDYFYWEVVVGSNAGVGICEPSETFTDGEFIGDDLDSLGWYGDGNIWYGYGIADNGPAYSPGDTLMFAVQGGGSSKYWLGVNGVWQGDPSTATGGHPNGFPSCFPCFNLQNGESVTANFGATAFAYPIPTGFVGFDTPSAAPTINVVPGEVAVVGAIPTVTGIASTAVAVIPGEVAIVGSAIGVSGVGLSDIEAWKAAVITAGGAVSDYQRDRLGEFISGLESDGTWPKVNYFWPLYVESAVTAAGARIDLKARLAATNIGTPTFTALGGLTFNGSSSALNLNTITGGTTQHAASFGFELLTDINNADAAQMGTSAPGFDYMCNLSVAWGDGNTYWALRNENLHAGTTAPGNTIGHWAVVRAASSGGDFIWGVNIHPSYGVSVSDILDDVETLNLKAIRLDIYNADAGSLATLAAVFSAADARGIMVIPVIIPIGAESTSEVTAYNSAFAVATTLATNFPGRIWHSGNELDLVCGIPGQDGHDPSDYDAATYNICRGAIEGYYDGFHGTDATARVAVGMAGDHWGFLERLIADGITWDYTTWHIYTPVGATGILAGAAALLDEIVAVAPGKQIIVTEFNQQDGHLATSDPTTLLEMMSALETLAPTYGIVGAIIYELYDEPALSGGEATYGIIGSDHTTINALGLAVQDYLVLTDAIAYDDAFSMGGNSQPSIATAPNVNWTLGAIRNASGTLGFWSLGQYSMCWIGDDLTATDVANIRTRWNDYKAAMSTKTIIAASGTYTITGTAAMLLTSPNPVLDASSGAYTIAGIDVMLEHDAMPGDTPDDPIPGLEYIDTFPPLGSLGGPGDPWVIGVGADTFSLDGHLGKDLLLIAEPWFDISAEGSPELDMFPPLGSLEDGWLDSETARTMIYIAATRGRSTDNTDIPPAQYVPGRLMPINFGSRIFDGVDPLTTGGFNFGVVTLIDPEGLLNYLVDLFWDSTPITIKRGARDTQFKDWPIVARFRSAGLLRDLDQKTISLRDVGWQLAGPLHGETYEGSGGVEGDPGLTGRIKPQAFGHCFNVEPVLLSASAQIFQWSLGTSEEVSDVRHGGVSLDIDADYANYAALAAATIPAGECATCLAQSLVRPNLDLEFGIRVDVIGEDNVTRASIVRQIATERGPSLLDNDSELDLSSFSRMESYHSAPVGWFFGSDITKQAAIDIVLRGVLGWSIFTPDGQLRVGWLTAPETQAATINLVGAVDDIGKPRLIATSPPRRGTRISWRWNYGRQPDRSSLAGVVSDTDAVLYGQEAQYAPDLMPELATVYPTAKMVTIVEAGFRDEADAILEASRQQQIFSVVRNRYERDLQIDPFIDAVGVAFNVADDPLGAPQIQVCVGLNAKGTSSVNTFEFFA